ncbi:phospholipase effector Tle1 domain-containing protein [Luteimonas sp. A537]
MTRTSIGAHPMPESGRRLLSPNAAQARKQALACLRENSSECQGQVHVNLFFDGTGNNRGWNGVFVSNPPKTRGTQTQRARNGHSNVARLWEASFDEPENGLFRIYIPGVGTPFPEVGDNSQDGSALGAGAALYGADRIHWAIIEIINAVHRYLTGARLIELEQARVLANEMSRTRLFEGHLRRNMLGAVARRLENVVKNHQRRVRSLNISVFGFSRGAAQARAFAHRLFEVAQVWGSGCGHNIGGVPMTLDFMGIFDTVASVGLAGMSRIADGKMDWADGEMMSIHPEVRQCVHFAALHEQRIKIAQKADWA